MAAGKLADQKNGKHSRHDFFEHCNRSFLCISAHRRSENARASRRLPLLCHGFAEINERRKKRAAHARRYRVRRGKRRPAGRAAPDGFPLKKPRAYSILFLKANIFRRFWGLGLWQSIRRRRSRSAFRSRRSCSRWCPFCILKRSFRILRGPG